MPMKSVVTAQELAALPDAVQGFYKPGSDGNHVLDVDVRSHPETLGLRNAMVSERDEAEKARKLLKAFEGVDPNEIATMKREKELLQREKDLAAGKFDKALNDATAELNTKLAKTLQERDNLAKRNHVLAINDTALREIVAAGGNPKMLLPHIVSVAELTDGGTVKINGADGKPLRPRNWTGGDEWMNLAEYVETMKADPDFAPAFKPNGARGSNAQPSSTTPTSTGTVTVENGSHVYR